MNDNVIDSLKAERKKALIAGLGASGESAKKAFEHFNVETLTFDANRPDADYAGVSHVDWNQIGAVAASPGFSPNSEILAAARENAVPIISEVGLARQIAASDSAQWVGITGTNGKTTTTEMTVAMIRFAGIDAAAVGNIGVPVTQSVLEKHEAYVAELSSFQLHYTNAAGLDCAAITNLADDHLDWHGSFEAYAADKAKIFENTKKAIVYNADDEKTALIAQNAKVGEGCIKIGFTLLEPQEGQIGIKNGSIVNRSQAGDGSGKRFVAKLSDFPFMCAADGNMYPHLAADALCALAVVFGLGIDNAKALEALRRFSPGDHRIKTVAVKKTDGTDIVFVDDSKATNSHAAAASLNSFADKSVVWIAGGKAKGARFEQLIRTQKQKIKAAVIIGVEQKEMREAFESEAPEIPVVYISPEPAGTVMQRAVEQAGRRAEDADCVLLAPACASMDQFKSYAERGDCFAKAAREYAEKPAQS